jgi:predicted nucleic acid-binding protein
VGAPGALAAHRCVGIDTSLFIYDWERHPTLGDTAHAVLIAIEAGQLRAVASTLLLAELLVGPLRAGRADVALHYRRRLTAYPNLSLVAPDADVCVAAARLRAAAPRLRLPDALHVATALGGAATAFVTNDVDLPAGLGLAILQLSEVG